ncbi:hypothetical protein ERO13_D13G216200v2 [Gossypium hirsutum]|uniref:Uncharacterized protein n=1 Tax=Gossypium hirsutum TaxID=3635 RepID=A0ABM3BEI9_GOSHI|nr:uncharacterized protein LOC121225291 [Gossypium hirsutum]KAG4113322.1 hypothetical protein ERO13_D13G216200v2 [Gossypium hirsutum]
MDYDRKRGVSLIQDDQMFFHRIISRDSSVGCSSRIYYYRSSEGIPFNWEMQPGTPKEPQKEDVLPPISPPPALLSLGLPKPRIDVVKESKVSKLKVFKFWKHGKKNDNKKKIDDHQSDKYSNYETCSSDDDEEFVGSPCVSSSSSSSFSFGSSSTPSRDSSFNQHYGCGPLNFASFLVRVSRSR